MLLGRIKIRAKDYTGIICELDFEHLPILNLVIFGLLFKTLVLFFWVRTNPDI